MKSTNTTLCYLMEELHLWLLKDVYHHVKNQTQLTGSSITMICCKQALPSTLSLRHPLSFRWTHHKWQLLNLDKIWSLNARAISMKNTGKVKQSMQSLKVHLMIIKSLKLVAITRNWTHSGQVSGKPHSTCRMELFQENSRLDATILRWEICNSTSINNLTALLARTQQTLQKLSRL